MKNKKLKSYVLPSLYACFFVGVLFVTIGIANVLTKKAPTNNTNEEINYVSESIVDDDEPVVKEENKILKPYTNDQVKIGKYYYDYKADETKQQNSITYHDNTYMQNSGIDYILEETFEVNSILDGTVTNVTTDELLGNCVEIKHIDEQGNIFYTFYGHMRDNSLQVTKGQQVVVGQVIGIQGSTGNSTGDHLHFEVRKSSGTNKDTIDPAPYLFMEKEG